MADDPLLDPSLRALQDTQADFDRDRGLNFEQGANADAQRTFTGLALAGEVGELANALKKAQRAIWLGDDPGPHLARSASETGDILAYLLKLATLLGVDLAEMYLTKMSDNCFRFAPRTGAASRARLITIAGPSGSGKTTVARALANEYVAFIEDVAENPHLDEILNRSEARDARANQRWFLDRVTAFVRATRAEHGTVIDQDPAAIVRAYARMFRDQHEISPAGYRALLLDLLRLESLLARWGRRTVVFLDARASTLRRRAELRRDPVVPPEAWFETVRGYFAELRAQVPGARIIETDDLDVDAMIAAVRQSLATTAAP